MVVPTMKVDIKEVMKFKNNPQELEAYIRTLIPERYRGYDYLLSNFKYYIVTKIHKELKVDKEERKALCNYLLKDIRTVGFINGFISLEDVERLVDRDRFRNLMKGN